MANPVQPNRPWELIQQNRRKLRTLADPAQVLAQTPQVIVEGTTDRDLPSPLVVPSPAADVFPISDASVTSYTLSQTPTAVTAVLLNGLQQRATDVVVNLSAGTVDVTALRRKAGDVLQVDYEH